jgi:tetratricopeptide (TPR) repeat protein
MGARKSCMRMIGQAASRVLILVLAMGIVPVLAQEGGDLQAQILYAYQTEDLNELGNLVSSLANQVKAGGADAALRYHLAHAQYRFGLLAAQKRPKAAAPAFADCVDELKPVLAQDVKSTEALALQSACYDRLAREKRLEAVLLRSRAEERLKQAFELEPRNPRVLYLMAMNGLEHSKPGSADRQRAFTQLQDAAKIFEQTSATRNDVPGWGHAEAYLALGAELEVRGDALGARNWIEKAVLAAPDYKAAQKQLSTLRR